jgi:hypothetical protein
MDVVTLLGIIALVIAVILYFVARSQQSKSTAMSVAETMSAQSLHELHQRIVESVGADALQEQCEVKGVIECDEPLGSPVSNTLCVAYRYTATREYEERVTETDDEGKRATRTESGSETVESKDERVRFWVRDDTGRVLVDPTEADIDMQETGEHYEQSDAEPRHSGRYTTGHRFTERALAVGAQVYVLGYAVDFQGQPMVGRHPRDQKAKFLISWRTEQELMNIAQSASQNLNRAAMVLGGLGVGLVIVGLLF